MKIYLLLVFFAVFMLFACKANHQVKRSYYIQGCVDGLNKDRKPITLNTAGGSVSEGLEAVELLYKQCINDKNYCEKAWKSNEQ